MAMYITDRDVFFQSKIVQKVYESEEVVNVCQAIQELRKESERDGELKKAREAAGKLYEMGLDTEKIAQAAIQK